SWRTRNAAISRLKRVTVSRDLLPYGSRAVSPKYTTDSSGRVRNSSRTAVRPPSPESNTPIGRGSLMTVPRSRQVRDVDRAIERQMAAERRQRLTGTHQHHASHLRQVRGERARERRDRQVLGGRPAAETVVERTREIERQEPAVVEE